MIVSNVTKPPLTRTHASDTVSVGGTAQFPRTLRKLKCARMACETCECECVGVGVTTIWRMDRALQHIADVPSCKPFQGLWATVHPPPRCEQTRARVPPRHHECTQQRHQQERIATVLQSDTVQWFIDIGVETLPRCYILGLTIGMDTRWMNVVAKNDTS